MGKVTLYGNQICDYVNVLNYKMTVPEIESTHGNTFSPERDESTILMARFTENIDGMDVTGLDSAVLSWSIYRLKIGDSRLEFVSKVNNDVTRIVDYLVANDTAYKYYIYPELATQIASRVETQDKLTQWWDYVIIGGTKTDQDNVYLVNADDVWTFKVNITSNQMERNIDKTSYNGVSKYSKVSVGLKNYATSGISCAIGDVNTYSKYYNDTADLLSDWNEFIVRNKVFVLKDRKGNVFNIQIMGSSCNIDDNLLNQMQTISFSWQEIGSARGISFISLPD